MALFLSGCFHNSYFVFSFGKVNMMHLGMDIFEIILLDCSDFESVALISCQI